MRLIDADALLAALKEDAINTLYSYSGESLNLLCLEVEEAPTIDPTSLVKRGRWIEIPDHYGGDNHFQCSACKEESWFKAGSRTEKGSKYCPNCGALMED